VATLYFLVSLQIRRQWTTVDLVSFSFLVLICAMFAYIAIGYGPQAESIQIDDEGLRLSYSSGRVQSIRWKDPRLMLILERYEPANAAWRYPQPMWVLLGNRPFQTYVTKEAFEEVIRRARCQGLTVAQKPASRTGWFRWVLQCSTT
jgi:hypothetical protein